MHALNSTVEVERLYDELREAIRANDQDGTQRVMAELVRARRPLAEIVGEVKRLSRGGTSPEAEPEPSTGGERPPPGTPAQPVETAPKAAPEPSYTHFSNPNTPAAGPLSPASTAVYREPERDAAVLRDWPAADVLPDPNRSRVEPTPQSFDGSAAFDLRGYPEVAPAPAQPDPPLAAEQNTPEPPDQHFEPAIEPEAAAPAVTAAMAAGEGLPAAPAPNPQQGAPAGLEHSTPEIPQQISGRAMALGVGLEGGEETDGAQSKHSARPRGAGLAAALVIILALAGGGAFFLMRPAGENIADKPAPSPAPTAAGPGAKPAPAGGNAAEATPSRGASGSPSGLAPTALLPAPAAPSPQARAAVPDNPAPAKPDAKPSVASLEPPSGALPKPSPAPDKPAAAAAPAASPVPVAPTEPPPPAQPRSSSLETASLLEHGDRLFGMGDVISARLFYERAAEAGDGQAALRLGETYDPTFLERAKLRAIKGDLKAAAFWYRRAKELGIVEADILLKGLQTK
jgi:hypothetical protein